MSATLPAIEFRNVFFSYGERPILKDVSFCLHAKHFVAIMGGSGSGKTTLLRLITGQLTPDQGEILIHGVNLHSFTVKQHHEYRRQMGVLFQFGALFTDLSVFENIAFPLREHTQLPDSIIHDLVTLKLHAVGLRGLSQAMPAELSGGMARRVALARTIALDPNMMLYDEPFTGLDPISLGIIAHLTSHINTTLQATSVMVTHDLTQSLKIADYVLFLANGEIVFAGTPQAMLNSDSPWILQFIGGQPEGPVPYRFPAPQSLQEDLLPQGFNT